MLQNYTKGRMFLLRARLLFVVILLCFFASEVLAPVACAQTTNVSAESSLDLMVTPVCPGFVLLGIEPTAIERPESPTDLLFTVLNQSENLGSIPQDFAMEFSPYWVMFGRNITYQDFEANRIKENLLQSLTVSIASSSSIDSQSTSIGAGIRFSLLRGRMSSDFNARMEEIRHATAFINDRRLTLFIEMEDDSSAVLGVPRGTPEYDSLVDKYDSLTYEYDSLVEMKVSAQVREETAETADTLLAIREAVANLPFRRVGWKLDVAGGLAFDFPSRNFDNGSLRRYGMWITGGYERGKLGRFGALSVIRWLGSDDEATAVSWDFGGRIIYDNPGKFSASVESVYRTLRHRDDTYRVALIVDYQVGKNKSLSFTYGRDFEGQQTGNVISLVNLVLGFGSARPID